MIFFNLKMTLYNKDCNEIMPTLQKELQKEVVYAST